MAPRKRIAPKTRTTDLSYGGTYTCPICRHGQISALVLMEAFACNFCHHIFTANLERQSLHTADSSQPLAWQWTGQGWRVAHQSSMDLNWAVWLMAVALVILPALLVGLTTYLFPPPESESWRFPLIWTGLTLVLHSLLVGWMLGEYHQIPLYIGLKVRLNHLAAWFTGFNS